MKTNKTLPILDRECISDTKLVFCIQKIIQYDDGNIDPYCDYIGAWDSDTGEIDKTMQDMLKREKELCSNNKYIKPFTFILRKVAIECKMKVISGMKDHFGNNNYQSLHCAECGHTIQYGDGFLTDAVTNNVYCDAECFMASRNIVLHDSHDSDYESHFTGK